MFYETMFSPIERGQEKGFTLIEMMIVVIILAVLASLAAPSFRQYILSQRIKNAAFDLNASLTYARSEAIMRNASVTVSKIGKWESGWNVQLGTTTLRTQGAYVGLVIDNGSDGGVPNDVVYDSVGRTGVGNSFRIKISDSSVTGVSPRYVCLSLTGLPYNKEAACQ